MCREVQLAVPYAARLLCREVQSKYPTATFLRAGKCSLRPVQGPSCREVQSEICAKAMRGRWRTSNELNPNGEQLFLAETGTSCFPEERPTNRLVALLLSAQAKASVGIL